MTELRFYLDENIPVEVARQLRLRGIDVVTARDLGLLGENDWNHLQNAAAQGRIFCTCDTDFLQLAASGLHHTGIVFGQQSVHYIGEWVNWLALMHAVYSAEELVNQVEYM